MSQMVDAALKPAVKAYSLQSICFKFLQDFVSLGSASLMRHIVLCVISCRPTYEGLFCSF